MLAIEPLTPQRWDDFAALCRQMGPNRSCWCMWWRDQGSRPLPAARQRAHALVQLAARPVGLIAYAGAEPAGWAAVAPRVDYPRLNRGRTTAPVGDAAGVWVVPCFFVVPGRRGRGVARALLDAAVRFAAEAGAESVEGVPVDPSTGPRSASATYTGTTGMFAAAGFREVARRTPKGRVVMRKWIRR